MFHSIIYIVSDLQSHDNPEKILYNTKKQDYNQKINSVYPTKLKLSWSETVELGLGTVQFGLDYGVSNKEGKVPVVSVQQILDTAARNGIRVLDTAAAYGSSEQVLGSAMPAGNNFKVITKLPALNKDAVTDSDIAFFRNTFEESLRKLGLSRIYGLLLHAPGDLLIHGGDAVYRLLNNLKEQGSVEKIGVSVYSGDELDRLLHYYDFDCVQLPLNVLDQNPALSGHIARLKTGGVEIHIRSAFLQGLLLMPPGQVNPFFAPILPVLERYRDFLNDNCLSPVEGAFAFLRAVKDIDVILVGVTGVKELEENIRAFSIKLPPGLDFSPFAVGIKEMVKPLLWKFKKEKDKEKVPK